MGLGWGSTVAYALITSPRQSSAPNVNTEKSSGVTYPDSGSSRRSTALWKFASEGEVTSVPGSVAHFHTAR